LIPRIVYLVIFLSGFASLGYELCWIRKGALLVGATPQALSIVVAVFFGGLAAGAYLFGQLSTRTGNPLLWYGMLECAVGLLAAATPALFGSAGEVSAQAYQWAETSQTLHLLVRSALVAAVILPTCVLIGGTLPLLCQFSIYTRQADIRVAAGILYAINTCGAFFGCMLCGIWFIPLLGIDAAIWLNAFISFTVGAGVILVSRTTPMPSRSDSSAPEFCSPQENSGSLVDSKLTGIILYALFFWAGFVALGYELLWVRFLSLLIHNTVYTCIFSLGAVLLGIAVGGLLVLMVKERPGQDILLFGVANIFIGFTVLLILLQPVASWEWIRNATSVSLQALLCIAIIFVPSLASGISFPLAYRLIATRSIHSGRDFGALTAVSTLGGIAGSLLIGFYLLPESGMYATLGILTCISLTIGTYAIFVFADRITLLRRGLIAGGVTVAWLTVLFVSTTGLPGEFLAGNRTMIEYAEGISSFVAVVKQGGIKTLEIDRMWQGQYQKGHQILAAHIPMILHQDPKRVLVIGMGTGQTASRFLMYNIDRLDCVDIEKTLPGMLQRHFDAAWLSDPRTRVVTDDGRNYTAHATSMYDIVSIEVGQSFRPQIASFYTVDFYRDVKKRLNKNGLACQFVPVGFFTEEQFRGVVRSFLEVFPQSTLWYNKYAEFMLIGNATQQPRLSAARLGMLRSDAKLNADLEYSFDNKLLRVMNRKEVFAANFLMGPETLSRLSAAAQPYNDDLPVLEYQTARNIYLPSRFHNLIENNLESPDGIFSQKISLTTEAAITKIREETVHEMLVEKK
jgi:spermidine synthase